MTNNDDELLDVVLRFNGGPLGAIVINKTVRLLPYLDSYKVISYYLGHILITMFCTYTEMFTLCKYS